MIIDSDYYLNVWRGKNTSEDLDRIISRAEDFVLNTIPRYNDQLVIKEELKKAISAQAEFFVENGLDSIFVKSDIKNVSIGDFSYSKEVSSSELIENMPILVWNYLRRGGYLFSGVSY